MGSTVSSNNYGLVRKNSKKHGHKKQGKRRDSVNRPVLKLQIYSNSLERQHKINGETSLDHPFLERLSSHNYGTVVDPESSVNSNFTTFNDIMLTTDGRHSAAALRKPSILRTNIPRSASAGYETPTSPSLITLQFVDNGESNGSLAATNNDHMCLVQYGMNNNNSVQTETVKSPNIGSNGNSLINKQISITGEPKLVTTRNEIKHRTYSMDDLSKPKLCHKTSIRISRRIRHSTSLHDDLENFGDIEVVLTKDDWTFGENIMRCLEDEGIVLFNIEEPQTISDKEVEATWPELKNKMKKWRSEQSLLDM